MMPKDVSDPGQVANADRFADSDTFTAGVTVSYWCKSGARLNEHTTLHRN